MSVNSIVVNNSMVQVSSVRLDAISEAKRLSAAEDKNVRLHIGDQETFVFGRERDGKPVSVLSYEYHLISRQDSTPA